MPRGIVHHCFKNQWSFFCPTKCTCRTLMQKWECFFLKQPSEDSQYAAVKIYWVTQSILKAHCWSQPIHTKGRGFQSWLSYSVNSERRPRVTFMAVLVGITPPNHTNKFCDFIRYLKDTFCKQIGHWANSANTVYSRVWKNLQSAIQDCHCELDDQCRGHNIKEKDHIVI